MWANTHYPQTITGLYAHIGNAMTSAVIERKIDHETLARSEVTPEQTDKLLKLAATMHKRYAINSQLRGSETKFGASDYTPRSIAGITHAAVSGVMSATANYAQAVLPRASALPQRGLPEMTLAKSDERKIAENKIIDELFSRSLVRRKLRPEAVALGKIWEAGAESLKGSTARFIGKQYRDHLRSLHAPDVTTEEWDESARQIDYYGRALNAVVSCGIRDSLPSIAEHSKVKIDMNVIHAFIDDTTDGIVRPRMPARLHIPSE